MGYRTSTHRVALPPPCSDCSQAGGSLPTSYLKSSETVGGLEIINETLGQVPLVHTHLSRFREQPIFTTRAHVFQIDPSTKKNWVPASKQAVTVSYFYDVTRNSYRIISVDGAKVLPRQTVLTSSLGFVQSNMVPLNDGGDGCIPNVLSVLSQSLP